MGGAMATENTHFGAKEISKALNNCDSIFFIGIGGINMSSLAHICKRRGMRVGGSDRARTDLTAKLEKEGIKVYYEHSADNVKGYGAVVYTVAISSENPEYVYARNSGLPCFSRADFLGYIMTGYSRRIGISGMHGKSTCTSMCAQTLIEGGAEPTVLSGAELPIMGGAYTLGGEENFVFEACEYMDSFLDFNPSVAVVLNIEMDHVDYFKSMEQIRRSYAAFTDITGKDGYAVYNADDAEVIRALEGYVGNRITFGIENRDSYYRAENISCRKGRYSFDVYEENALLCRVTLSVTGYYNIYNALACVAVCRLAGLDAEKIAVGLCHFCGASRRMELKGQVRGADVYDDYGHHPTEVKATLSGARGLVCDGGRLICVFQPHTYSRTSALLDGFADALAVADRVIVADIYAARETDTLGVSAELLASKIGKCAEAVSGFENIASIINCSAESCDAVIVMGAGDIYKVFNYLDFDGEEK